MTSLRKVLYNITAICFTMAATMDIVASKQRQLQVPDLPGNCQLFFQLGYDIQALDDESMDRFYKDDSVMILAQAGAYYGKDAIREYVGFATAASPFIDVDIELALDVGFATYNDPTVVAEDDPNVGLCEFLIFFGSRTRTSVELSVNNETVERPTLVKIYYDPAVNKVDHVAVHYDPGWLTYFFGRLDTQATTSFMCDTMLSNACQETAPAMDGVAMSNEDCMERMSALPLADGDLAYVDAKSRGCRMLHSVFANENPFHCAHLSFDPLADDDGAIKCQTGAGYAPSDFFSPDDFAAWENFKVSFGLFNDEPVRVVGRDDVLCPQGRKLSKKGTKCKKVCRRLEGLRLDKATNKCERICPVDKVFDPNRKECV